MTRPRLVLASSSVMLLLAVIAIATPLGPAPARPWLIAAGVLAAIAAIQSVASDPRDLTAALLLSLPAVIALLAAGSPTWLIGPLAVMLLASAELNALSWDCQGAETMTAAQRARLVSVAPLAGVALAGSLAVGLLAAVPAPGGAIWVALAAATLAGLARVVLKRSAP